MFALADCNNFFVSCERVFRPDLNGRAVIVLSNNDGCAIARSNEAKALGIKMGAPLFKIRDIVREHNVEVFSGNMALYGDMSRRVRWTLEEFVPFIEVYSIDEAFMDLRGLDISDYDAFAKAVSARCWRNVAIPVSVGVSHTKTLAKIAASLCKKYPKLRGGCFMAREQDVEKVLRRYPVGDVWGIGRRSVAKLTDMGVQTAWDFTRLSEGLVHRVFGLSGLRTWRELRGESCIELDDSSEGRQSICVSRSFSREITDCAELSEQVATFAAKAVEKLRAQHSACVEMVVFAYTNRFREDEPQTSLSRAVLFDVATADHRRIISSAVCAMRDIFRSGYGYKKAGVVITKLVPESGVVLSLFDDGEQRQRDTKLSAALDSIKRDFGRDAVRFASQGTGEIISSHERQSPHYTTLWSDIPKVSVK